MAEPIFCPSCFAQISVDDEICPRCHASLKEWQRESYSDRLIAALRHPLSEVRMRAIISLGWRGELAAERALVDCALRHPLDVVEGLEIIRSLRLIRGRGSNDSALQLLMDRHPARVVRETAAEILANSP